MKIAEVDVNKLDHIVFFFNSDWTGIYAVDLNVSKSVTCVELSTYFCIQTGSVYLIEWVETTFVNQHSINKWYWIEHNWN